MRHFVEGTDRGQSTLFPECLEDWIGEDNPVLDTRELIAARFRREYGSCDPQDSNKANVYPYFIGVFDTVAALGRTGAVVGLLTALVLVVAAISWAVSVLSLPAFSEVRFVGWLLKYLAFEHVFYTLAGTLLLIGLIAFLRNHFEQVWFPGIHADVGGGYPENESRLSDITLKWMLAAASIIPNGIKHDGAVLRLYPDPTGPQHDECKAGHWQKRVRDLPADKRTGISEATMHKSVYARFAAKNVVQYDVIAPYRPINLKNHIDFLPYYGKGASTTIPPPKAIADDIEAKWERLLARQVGSNG
jgi:hypothetical protein